jgi:hypothetical protein
MVYEPVFYEDIRNVTIEDIMRNGVYDEPSLSNQEIEAIAINCDLSKLKTSQRSQIMFAMKRCTMTLY